MIIVNIALPNAQACSTTTFVVEANAVLEQLFVLSECYKDLILVSVRANKVEQQFIFKYKMNLIRLTFLLLNSFEYWW